MRRNRLLCILAAVLLLTAALSGCAQQVQPVPTLAGGTPAPSAAADSSPSPTAEMPETPVPSAEPAPTPTSEPMPESEPTPAGTPEPTPEPPGEDPADQAQPTCTLAISCSTILDNLDKLTKGKDVLVPENGWILYEEGLPFTEGESVFDVLKRELTDRMIHMEFSTTPLYQSIYIEGIANLYEFDCGELSGWMYRVNGTYPNYSCSEYTLSDGDVVEWLYTCDLGDDIGGGNFLE